VASDATAPVRGRRSEEVVVRIDEDTGRRLLAEADHGVLSTVHPSRGIDAVPVVFALDGDHLAVPVDRVKPKSAGRLQRERNLEHDPRAALLVDRWDADDWSALWWVRARLRWNSTPGADVESRLADHLADRYAQYVDRPFDRLLVFDVHAVTGWSASERPTHAH
jgi:PPOX class probable F420-dependent enzyme